MLFQKHGCFFKKKKRKKERIDEEEQFPAELKYFY